MEKTDTGKMNSFKICVRLYWEFLKIGLFTIGGGMAMIPQLQQVAVNDKKWLSEEEMIDCIAISQALPGIIAINCATFVGMKQRGFLGAVAATLGVVTPSLVIIILAVTVLDSIGHNSYVQGAFTGVKAAVCGLILVTVIKLGKQILKSWFSWTLAVLSFIVIIVLGVNAIWAILAGAVLGVAYNSMRMRKEDKKTPSRENRFAAAEENFAEAQGDTLHDEEVDG